MTNLRLKIHEKEVALKLVWDRRHEKSAKMFSKAHLQHWSAALYANLPRELRDMVYSLSLDHDWNDHMLVESLSVLYGFSRPQLWDHDRLKDYVLLDPSFVIEEVAIEVAEMIYARAQVPSFGMKRREGKPRVLHMREFLKRDFFGLGTYRLSSTTVLCQNLNTTLLLWRNTMHPSFSQALHPTTIANETSKGILPASYIRRLELKLLKRKLSTRNQNALRDNIKSLLLCRHNRHLRVDIVFPRGNSAIDVLFFLHILYSTYVALVSPNITFDLTYKRRVHEANPPDADKDETQILNLTHMLELPRVIWRDHLMALCECVGKLSVREQRWRGHRALKKGSDVWVGEEEGVLAILDPYGRDAWAVETGYEQLWGECWNQEHWLEGTFLGLYEEMEVSSGPGVSDTDESCSVTYS